MSHENQITLKERCHEDLAKTKFVDYCDAVLEFVFSTPSVSELSVPLVSRNVNVEAEVAWEILSYLSGARAALLDMKFVYIDEYDNEFFLDANDIEQLVSKKTIAHPNTGEELSDVDDYVFPVFIPTEKLIDLRGESV
jgi:hypothetical protein